MKTYITFQYECSNLASEITDCYYSVVFYLIQAAACSDFDVVIDSCCKTLDSLTGCGYEFIRGRVLSLSHRFFE